MADTEYTFRITAGKARVGWYTGSGYVYIKNQNSGTWLRREKAAREVAKLKEFYVNENSDPLTIRKLKTFLPRFRYWISSGGKKPPQVFSTPWEELCTKAETWLRERSGQEHPRFLWNKKELEVKSPPV